MNLDVITNDLGLDARHYVKPAVRKSPAQPHTWFIADGRGIRYVAKFAVGSGSAAALVRNEIAFYNAAHTTPGAEDVAAALPKLVRTGELPAGPYVVLEYCAGLGAQRWIVRAMRSGSFQRVLVWQAGALGWLAKFQACEPLRAALGAAEGEVVCHNDFNHFNIVGEDGAIKVVDWENWSAGPSRSTDALHTLAGPAFAMGPEQFAALWQSDTPYRQGALRLLEPFLGGRDWRDCMAEYVEFQRTLLGDEAPEVAAKFEQAAKEWAVA